MEDQQTTANTPMNYSLTISSVVQFSLYGRNERLCFCDTQEVIAQQKPSSLKIIYS